MVDGTPSSSASPSNVATLDSPTWPCWTGMHVGQRVHVGQVRPTHLQHPPQRAMMHFPRPLELMRQWGGLIGQGKSLAGRLPCHGQLTPHWCLQSLMHSSRESLVHLVTVLSRGIVKMQHQIITVRVQSHAPAPRRCRHRSKDRPHSPKEEQHLSMSTFWPECTSRGETSPPVQACTEVDAVQMCYIRHKHVHWSLMEKQFQGSRLDSYSVLSTIILLSCIVTVRV